MDFPTTWFNGFVGVGYKYHDEFMNVFPLLSDKQEAQKLWKRTVDWWPDDKIKMRFVEDDGSYWFLLFGGSEYSGDNTGFVKKVPISDNYKRFRMGFDKRATLRFAIYKPNPKKGATGYNLNLLKPTKSIYDVSFINLADLGPDTVEYKAIREQLSEKKI